MNTAVKHDDYQLPVMAGPAKEFYDLCREHKLSFQRCVKCKTFRHPPRPLCAKCQSFETEWAQVKGTGKLYAWTIPMNPIGKAWVSYMPYVAAIVELDEGMRMATWVTDIAHDKLKIGLPVKVYYDALTPEVTVAKFRPA